MLAFNLNQIMSPNSCLKLSQIFLINSLAILVLCQAHVDSHSSAESPASYTSLLPFMSLGVLDNDTSSSNINQIFSNLSLFNDESSEIDSMTVTLLENVTHACLQRCIEEETLFLNDFGIKCQTGDSRPECYRSRCFKGCELWWHALKEFEPCQEACSSTQFYPFDLPCISACETTQRQYWHLQRLHVELLMATSTTSTTTAAAAAVQPQLLHDNETLNTLTLKWPITTIAGLAAQYLASRPFNIQYQYVLSASLSTVNDMNSSIDMNRRQQSKQQHANLGDKQSSKDNDKDDDEEDEEEEGHYQNQLQEQWWNLADYNCNENFECDIMDGLMPYTSYKFRFELPFGDNIEDVLYSPPSDIFTTPALGRPISKPILKHLLALDDSHIAVFWQAGKFINGPLKNYKIKLQHEDSQFEVEKLLSPDITYFIFSNLLPSTLYTLHLSLLNEEGEGPSAQFNITTKSLEKSSLKLDDLSSLLVLGEYSIILKSLDPLVESKVIFKSEEILKDFDILQSTKQLFLVNNKGVIISLFLDNPINYTILNLNATEFMPSKLAVDWLNQRLFMAGETSLKTWQISSMDFNSSFPQIIAKDLKNPLINMQIDPINGWLFASDKIGQLLRINLATLKCQIIELPYKIQHFTNNFDGYLLKVFNNDERKIYEISYDGKYSQKLENDLSASLQGDILSFQFIEANAIVMNNGSHLLRQVFEFNEMEIMALKEVELCIKIIPLLSPLVVKEGLQPLPKPLGELENLQAVLSDNKAKITWDPPIKVQQFQTAAAWKQWEYELEILDVPSNNAFNIRSIKSTHFQVERLQANNLYKIKVRAMFAGSSRPAIAATTSQWSQELITRTWPMGEHMFLWASESGLWQTMTMFKDNKLKALAQENIKSFVQVNATLYYINQLKNHLSCLNLMNPEVPCGFRASNAYGVAYDWRGGQLYWSDIQRNCIIRSELRGENMELLPIFEAKSIKLDSLKGHIYFTTDSRLLRKKLNGGLAGQELEYYHVSGTGEILLGFALDLAGKNIYWLVQHQEGLTKVFRSDLDLGQMETVYDFTLRYQIQQDSFNYLPEIESFIWLKALQKEAVLFSKENLKQLTQFPIPVESKVNFISMRQDFTPFMDLAVRIEAVDKDSIHITEGYWDDFNIKWSPVANSENLTIFYKVLISSLKDPQHLLTFEVQQPIVRITEFKLVGHVINVTITPASLWSLGSSVTIELRTPAAAPKQPKNLRVYVEQTMEPLQNHSYISALVRWDSPDNISAEKEVFYKVFCWLKEDLHSVEDIEDMGLKTHEVRFNNLLKEETYMFQVQAFSLSRAQGGEKTSLLTHFINPDVQSIPKLLFTTTDFIGELDLDLNMTKVWVHTSSEVEHLALITGEHRLIWVNENVELMTYQPGAAALKLARMRAEVLALTVDWILRKVYWAEMSGDMAHVVDIYELDLNQYEGKVMLGSKLFSLTQGKLLKNLIILPYSRTLLWLEYEMGAQNCSLEGHNLTDLSEFKFKNHQPFIAIFEGSLLPEMESVNLVDFKGKLTAYEIQRQLTTVLKIPYNPKESFTNFERDTGYIYTLANHTIKAFNRRKHNMEFSLTIPEIRLIKAINFQEYPKRDCLLLDHIPDVEMDHTLAEWFVQEVTENNILIDLMQNNNFEKCKLPVPGLKYELTIKGPNGYQQSLLKEPGPFVLTDLKPFTNYSLEIKISSYYQQKLMLNELIYPEFFIRTLEGCPTIPQNFTVSPLSPTEIFVAWSEPEELNAEAVTYQLSWQMHNSSLTSHKIVEGFEMNLVNLESSQEYLIWLEVYSKPSKLNKTEKVLVKTYPEPEAIQLVEKQAYNLTLHWLPNTLFDSIILECRPITQDPDLIAFSVDITGLTDNITITNLEPKTNYEFYLKLYFNSVGRPYLWPEQQSSHFIFETLADAPGRPGQPQIEHITGEIFKVFWESAPNNGANIVEYSLEALQARQHKRIRRDATQDPNSSNKTSSISLLSQLPWVEELQPIEDKWLVYCNTSELSCIVRELHTMRLQMFRVRARNDLYGWGPYSEESERVLEPFVSPQKRNSLVLAIIAPAAIVTTCVVILFVIRKVHQRRLKAKQLLAKSRPSIWSNFSTIQQQQLASRNRAFSMTSASTMYTGGPLSDADIALLPHINWSQITLLNFLGSGAFGEVYEGMIKHDDQEEPEKVAIKSLRKGSSEFAELLKEAQLMSNFKHDNIVRLIGVCCDTESISIIMEHMEGGDLLTYLRESRPNSTKPVAALQLLDLMTMCIDIATGMAYLEDMHFVHRDLACRNCLVSSRIPSKRTVKIGDFGLARDIYKNDYYRKEGEALMPVRWMAPESLVDGVFTTQTDVWAFGVLCWEILTLGQQPYAARNNFEVLNFVKEGGRLEQPDNCPDKLFSLMLECWHTEPDERPSFRKCFNTLLAIKTDVRRVSLGYNIDDSDYATYANQHGILVSSFLASSNLNSTKEEPEEEEDNEDEDLKKSNKEIKQNSLNLKNEQDNQWSNKMFARNHQDSLCDKLDLKVRFNNNVSTKDIDGDSLNDESHLIDTKLYRIQENPDYYNNEGISRL